MVIQKAYLYSYWRAIFRGHHQFFFLQKELHNWEVRKWMRMLLILRVLLEWTWHLYEKKRLPSYKHDWLNELKAGFRIFAPPTYNFFASALPVIAFGEQVNKATDDTLTAIQTLISTGLCGIIHALIGGQLLFILGVKESTVLIYTYMYKFTKDRDDLQQRLFLAWAGWACVWTTVAIYAC